MAAVLDAGPGAVLSHRAAAGLWGLHGFDLGELHVSRARGGTSPSSTSRRQSTPTTAPSGTTYR